MRNHYPSIFLLVVITLDLVECGYRLEVRVNHYKNPSHQQEDGTCCHQQFTLNSCSPCSNRFFFCLQRSGLNIDDKDMTKYNICPEAWLSHFTGLMGQDKNDPDDISFEGEAVIDQLNGVHNPLVFTSDDPWPGDFQLVVAIKNWRSIFEEYFVDIVLENWELQGDEYQFASKTLEGVSGRSTLTVSARVLCSRNTHGLHCNETTDTLCPEYNLPVQAQDQDHPVNSSKVLGFIESGYYELVASLSVVGATFGFLILVAAVSFISYLCYEKKRKKKLKKDGYEEEPFLKQSTDDGESPRYYTCNTHNKTVEDEEEDMTSSHDGAPTDGGIKEDIDSQYSVIRLENMEGNISEELLDEVEGKSEEDGKEKEEKCVVEDEKDVKEEEMREEVEEEEVNEVRGAEEDEKDVEVEEVREDVEEEEVNEVRGAEEDEKDVEVEEVREEVEEKEVNEVRGAEEDEQQQEEDEVDHAHM